MQLRTHALFAGLGSALLAGLLTTAVGAQDSAPSTKVVVRSGTSAALDELLARGARKLADRGGYMVLEANPSDLPAATDEVAARPDFDSIKLRRRTLRTQEARSAATRVLPKPRAGRRLKLVQLTAPPVDSDLDVLNAAGARVVQYIPENAYLVWTKDAASGRALAARTAGSTLVQYLEDYDPEYALSPALDARVGRSETVDVTVQLFNEGQQSEDDIEMVTKLAAGIIEAPRPAVRDRYVNLRAAIAGDDLAAIAALPTVVNVEPYKVPRLFGERQGQILAGNLDAARQSPSGPGYLAWLAALGFSADPGDFSPVAVVDDGVDNGTTAPANSELYLEDNPTLASRLAFSVTPPGAATSAANGPDGHGSLNASIIAGYNSSVGTSVEDAEGFNYGLGIVPYGRIGNVRIFTPEFDIGYGHSAMVADYAARGARISSNSWGADVQGDYDADSQEYDALTRDAEAGAAGNQELLFVFAAGNAGPSLASVGSPATAKNVLSVGASESSDPSAALGSGCGDTLADGDDARDIAAFSSRGPAVDGRMKPDVVAPGTFIHGAASKPVFNGSGVCGAVTNDFTPPGTDALFPPLSAYTWSSGTSHATPAVAGYAALATEYLQRSLGLSNPSPAVLKALVINSARHLSGNGANDTLPSPSQGFGLPSMAIAFDPNVTRFVSDQETTLTTSGEAITIPGTIPDPNQPLRVTLVWTDAPGPTFGNAYVNNLDLTVTVGGNAYRGNNFALGVSKPNGTADPRNNVEAVVLPAGQAGAATITVEGFTIAGDGVPGNIDVTDQDFALVATNFTDVSSAGSIRLDAALYSCAAAVVVTLKDIDLAGAGTAVAAATTTTGDIETLILTENPIGSGVFKLTLTTGAGAALAEDGILQAADGGTITVAYADADDGSGPALVDDSAAADCKLPSATSVATSVGGTFAVVDVDTDEPTSVIVRYGTGCGALTGIVQSNLSAASHSLTIVGLLPLQAHFFSVEIIDLAGNTVVDDSGGSCYSFSTLDPPDYFTEWFNASDFDLDNRVLTLIPDASGNAYHACTSPAVAFGTDPSGGTAIALSDDASQRIDFAGGAQVPFYGTPRSILYVNSNGNLSFDVPDTDFTESLIDHFKLARVSALFHDLDPGSGGSVSWKQTADRIAVTFENVPRIDSFDSNSFQIELLFDGTIRITYLGIAVVSALVGISEGLDLPQDFIESDFTAYAPCSISAGRVLLDAPIYTCTDVISVTLDDPDLAATGSAEIQLTATGGDAETVTLTETSTGSGSFVAAVPTASGTVQAGDGVLQITSTQTIAATYDDADDGSGSPAQRTVTARTLCTDHFTAYKTKVSRGGTAFYKFGPVTLADELRTGSYDIVKPMALGAPADKNGEGLNDATTHLQEYKIKATPGTPKFDKVSDVRVISQCGDLYLRVLQPFSLLLPSYADPTAPVAMPLASEHEVDHFVCYRAKALKKLSDGTRVTGLAKGTQASFDDGFQTRRYDLKRVNKLCLPAAKSGSPVYLAGPDKGGAKEIQAANVRNPGDRLICYKATLAKKLVPQDGCGPIDPKDSGTSIEPPQEKHTKLTDVHVSDQFGAGQRNTIREVEVCIPSLWAP